MSLQLTIFSVCYNINNIDEQDISCCNSNLTIVNSVSIFTVIISHQVTLTDTCNNDLEMSNHRNIHRYIT